MTRDSTDDFTPKALLPLCAWQRIRAWALENEGSTRSSAILRIVIIACVWTAWGDRFAFFSAPSWSSAVLSLAFYGSTLLAFIGLWTRPACAVAAALAAYGYFYLGQTQLYAGWTNHFMKLLTISTCLLPFIPAGRSYSVDRWLAVRRAARAGREPPAERGDLWGLRLMAIFLSSLYLSTAHHKTTMPWLSGARLEAIIASHYFGSVYMAQRWWTGLMQALAIATWALEWMLPIGLWFQRTRRWLVLGGILMHVTFYAMFEVFTFTTNMVVLYLAFISPQAVHDFLQRMFAPAPASEHPVVAATPYSAAPIWWACAGASLFLLAVPVRASFPVVFGTGEEPRDPIHPTSASWVQLELRLSDDPSAEPLDWGAVYTARDQARGAKQRWPPRVQRINEVRGVASVIRTVCNGIDSQVSLTAQIRRTTIDGWVELDNPDGDVCRRRGLDTRSPPPIQAGKAP
jgi:uncharacterized membrane protein YphA (DoxX/SURF4 family)